MNVVEMEYVEEVQSGAFFFCTSLKSVNLPSCTLLSDGSFARSSSLTNVSIPSALTIGRESFCGCHDLRHVKMGRDVKQGRYAFDYCLTLEVLARAGRFNVIRTAVSTPSTTRKNYLGIFEGGT